VAYSSDGFPETIYTSTNSGSSWVSNNAPLLAWTCAASSADGTKLAAININGGIYVSTNSGAIWTLATNLPNSPYGISIASSADGSKLMAAAFATDGSSGAIYTSTNSGFSWVSNSVSTNTLHFLFLASSADASKVATADNYGYIYTSTNLGSTWLQTTAPLGNWQGIASSADGNKLAAVDQGLPFGAGPIYTSTDAGLTWISNNVPSQTWTSISSSADGSILVAVANNFNSNGNLPIYISTNSGASWTLDAVSNDWGVVTSSADGTRLVAATGTRGVSGGTKTVSIGNIYTSQIALLPRMNIQPVNGNLTVSWVVPSTNYVMQQSSDLMSWSNVTNQPVLNLTNLQNEVILPPPGSNTFYRLKTP